MSEFETCGATVSFKMTGFSSEEEATNHRDTQMIIASACGSGNIGFNEKEGFWYSATLQCSRWRCGEHTGGKCALDSLAGKVSDNILQKAKAKYQALKNASKKVE